MLVNNNDFGILTKNVTADSFQISGKMKYEDMIFNQFDEDVDDDADGSELFSLINQSLEHFNQSVHSSGFEKDGGDSAYETVASSLSIQNDFNFHSNSLNYLYQQPTSNGVFKNENYRLNFKDMLNSKRSLLNNERNLNRINQITTQCPNESSSFNEKFLRCHQPPISTNFTQNSRVRLQSSSSACDPLISCFINTNKNSSSPSQAHQGSPDYSQNDCFDQIVDKNTQRPLSNTINGFDQSGNYSINQSNYSRSLNQNSDIFSQISIGEVKQRKPSGPSYLCSTSANYSQPQSTLRNSYNTNSSSSTKNINSYYNSYNKENKNGSIHSPPLSIYKTQGSSAQLNSNKKLTPASHFNYATVVKDQIQTASDNQISQSKNACSNGSNINRISKGNRACSFFLRGHCKKRDCEFAHDLRQVTCRFWEYGSCFKGNHCPFLHGYPENVTPPSTNLDQL